MASRAGGCKRGCYNAQEAFHVLMEDVDSDEEDFEEPDVAVTEPD